MIRYLLAVLLLSAVLTQNTDMRASCQSPFKLNLIPVSLQETEVLDVDDFIYGFNLKLEMNDEPSFVTLSDKFVKKASRNLTQKGLRNYHLQHTDNTWGKNFISISEDNFTTTVRWGRLDAIDSVPNINGQVSFTTPNLICYDAVLFLDMNLIMVDCSTRSGSGLEFGFKNKFLYIDTVKQQLVKKEVENELYVTFTRMTFRRMFKFSENGYNYLMRIYYADGVDEANKNNTYFELLSANNPYKPFVIKVIDRSFLDMPTFTIMDFKLYLGDMYLLDYHQGIIRMDITGAQHVLITGRYRTDSGFRRFGVYSNNLDNEFLLVLANRHAIYEVDWTDQIRPKIVTKYSLMSDSFIRSLWVNHNFVIVQAQSNTTSGNIYNFTWIFNKNSRVYTNAYAVISHSSPNTFVDYNRELSFIMSIDEDYIQMYELNIPRLMIAPSDPIHLDREFIFSIVGRSVNPVTNNTQVCTFTYKVVVVKPDNYTLWPTGLAPSKEYFSNYPGQLFIPLNRYVLGPNVTWDVHEESVSGELPAYWILQQNKSFITWDVAPNLGKLSLLRQEQYESLDKSIIYMYMQDIYNKTFFARCTAEDFKKEVKCNNSRFSIDNDQILNFTVNRFHQYGGSYEHVAALVMKSRPNEILVKNVENDRQLFRLQLEEGFAGFISSIEFSGHYLIAVLKYAKQIRIWDIRYCIDFAKCPVLYNITAQMMWNLGVTYFSPLVVETSDFHPFVMFIQMTDSVLILDLTRNGPIKLAQIISQATKELGYWGWRMAISQDHLVIVNAPDIIEEHNIADIQKKHTFLARHYPLYYYTIPEKFDLDFSDAGGLIYITGMDKTSNKTVLLIYRAGLPTVATFYDVFYLDYRYEDVLVDATGVFCDYVIFSAENSLNLFRQFEIPILVFEDTWSDFSFNLSYTNAHNTDHRLLMNSTVRIANYPVEVTIKDNRLKDKNFLNGLLQYKDDQRVYVINDHNWFNGTVINYTLKCEDECGPGGKIEVVNHVQVQRKVLSWYGMQDYTFTMDGGVIQQGQTIITIRHNGTIQEYIDMPTVLFGEVCTSVAVDWFGGGGIASACRSDSEVYLYYTAKNSHKPFCMGPQPSMAEGVAKIEMFHELLFLTDVDDNVFLRQREGAIIIYTYNADINEPEFFDELEVIDSNDLIGAEGWDTKKTKVYIANSHIAFTNETGLYRLFITEVDNGLFVVDFKWLPGRDEITLLRVTFVNLREKMIDKSLPMPNAATFQGVTILRQSYDAKNNNWLIDLAVSIRNFHTIEVQVFIAADHKVLLAELVHAYYRYSFYESSNYIKSFDGYFALIYKLPDPYQAFQWLSLQVLAVYDSRPNRTEINKKLYGQVGDLPASHMMGGLAFNDTGRVTFDFNFTIRRNQTDPFSNIGMVLVDGRGQEIVEVALSQSIHIRTKKGIKKTQHVQLIAENDFSRVALPIEITVHGSSGKQKLAGWAIALIVIGSLAFGAGLGYFGWRLWKQRYGHIVVVEQPIKKSLLESEAEMDNSADTPVVMPPLAPHPEEHVEAPKVEAVVEVPAPVVEEPVVAVEPVPEPVLEPIVEPAPAPAEIVEPAPQPEEHKQPQA